MDSQKLPMPETDPAKSAVIKVFGVGGGGCNALEQLITTGIRDVEFKCINTDIQALAKFKPENIIELGAALTKGLGAGANPEVGSAAAEESRDEIAAAIGDADMLFLTAGMGGGTGTGAVPLVAKIAREMGVLTVAVVTEPFAFEGKKRQLAAEEGLERLKENADSMIVVPNENLLTFLGPNVSLIEAFAAANDVIANAVQSIAELITTSGLINVDFADVKTVMSEMGHAIMSTGSGMGEHRAEEAAIAAIKSPLLNNVDLKAAKGILANITSSSDLSMGEFQAIGDIIRKIAADDATVVIGTVFDDEMSLEMKVTVVATGLRPPKSKTLKSNNDSIASKLTQSSLPATAHKTAAEPSVVQAKSADDPPVVPTQSDADQPEPVIEAKEHDSNSAPTSAPATSAPVLNPEKCMICGNDNGTHKDKCPWATKAETESELKSELVTEDTGQTDSRSVKKSGGVNKKVGLGIAAAFMALSAGVYVFLGSGEKLPDSIVANEETSLDGSSDEASANRDVNMVYPYSWIKTSPQETLVIESLSDPSEEPELSAATSAPSADESKADESPSDTPDKADSVTQDKAKSD